MAAAATPATSANSSPPTPPSRNSPSTTGCAFAGPVLSVRHAQHIPYPYPTLDTVSRQSGQWAVRRAAMRAELQQLLNRLILSRDVLMTCGPRSDWNRARPRQCCQYAPPLLLTSQTVETCHEATPGGSPTRPSPRACTASSARSTTGAAGSAAPAASVCSAARQPARGTCAT